jgi:hypothetical protein
MRNFSLVIPVLVVPDVPYDNIKLIPHLTLGLRTNLHAQLNWQQPVLPGQRQLPASAMAGAHDNDNVADIIGIYAHPPKRLYSR